MTNPNESNKKPCACLCGCVSISKVFRFSAILSLCLVLGFAAFLYVVKKPPSEKEMTALGVTFETTTMTLVKRETAERIPLRLEVANTPDKQALGLMFRDSVPQGTGMLFSFFPPRPVSFWMKNTKVSLDILFLAMNGRIQKIVPRTTPYDLSPISSEEPVAAVLEIKGGEAERLGVTVGDALQ